jgi:hypothetical protein
MWTSSLISTLTPHWIVPLDTLASMLFSNMLGVVYVRTSNRIFPLLIAYFTWSFICMVCYISSCSSMLKCFYFKVFLQGVILKFSSCEQVMFRVTKGHVFSYMWKMDLKSIHKYKHGYIYKTRGKRQRKRKW